MQISARWRRGDAWEQQQSAAARLRRAEHLLRGRHRGLRRPRNENHAQQQRAEVCEAAAAAAADVCVVASVTNS